jgi:hypothetical protein
LNSYNNAIDLYVWQMSDGQAAVGTKQVLSATSAGVGVFTTNPAYALDVAGVVNATAGYRLAAYNGYLVDDYFSSASNRVGLWMSGGNMKVFTSGLSSAYTVALSVATGDGTFTDLVKTSVTGGTTLVGGVTLSNAYNASVSLTASNACLGVNNASPAYALDVVGTIKCTSKIRTPLFQALPVFSVVQATWKNAVSSTLTFNGGTLFFTLDWSWYTNTASSSDTVTFTLFTTPGNVSVATMTKFFLFNQSNLHLCGSHSQIISNITAGTYYLKATYGNIAVSDNADTLNGNVIELPF